jgi:hypothetical protein
VLTPPGRVCLDLRQRSYAPGRRDHMKRAAHRSPGTPPSDPDPLGDLSLQGGRGNSILLVAQLNSAPSPVPPPGPKNPWVAPGTSRSGEPPARLPPGRPVRRAAFPLGKVRFSQSPAWRNGPAERGCGARRPWPVDTLWTTVCAVVKPTLLQTVGVIRRLAWERLERRASARPSPPQPPAVPGAPRPPARARRPGPGPARHASASARPRRTPRAASP